MKIDKTSFLLLAGALAMTACSTEDSNDNGGNTGGTGGEAGSAGAAGSSAVGGQGGQGGQGAEGGQAGQGAEGGEGGQGAESGQGGQGAEGGAAGEGGTGGSSCDDSVGNPAACTELDGGECGSWAVDYCEIVVEALKPAVAEAAVQCMLAATKDECMDPDPYDCVRFALGDACEDPTTDQACDTVVKNCKETADECHALLDGLSDAGRKTVMKCVEDDCSWGLWSCVESF